MRIKRLEIHGFKSFAERTVIHFGDGITGVVGPNGCGKSNIVDALRWAMGEQSAKHLRGNGMDDVIFAGSESRGPLGMAEVTITFKNDGSLVPPEYRDCAEISVTRRLFRDGTSEYLINRTRARLKDVYDLFLGTGIGTKSYSIIEQGRIGLIVTSKPEDRRSLIEDAAGISKYKARRKTAERKLEATEQNMLRVSDIVTELGARLGSLEKQAEKAERYRALKTELKGLDLHASVHQLLELMVMEAMEARIVGDGRAALEEEDRALTERENAAQERMGDLDAKEADLRQREQDAQRLEQDYAVGEKNLEHLERERVGLEGRRVEAESERARLEVQREEARAERRDLLHLGEALAAASGEEASTLQEEQASLEARENELEDWARELEGKKRLLVECLTQVAQNENHQKNLEDKTGEVQGRIERLEREADRAKGEAKAAEHAARELKENLDQNRQLSLALEDERASQEALLERSSAEFMDNEARLLEIREELMDKRSRLSSLEEIQKNYEGCSVAVRAIMKHAAEDAQLSEKVHGLVADVVSSEPKFETAIEAVLGDRLQYVVVENQDEGIASVEYLKAHGDGRSSFVPLDLREDHASWAPRKTTRPPVSSADSVSVLHPATFAQAEAPSLVMAADAGGASFLAPAEAPAPSGESLTPGEATSAPKSISDKPPPAELSAFAFEAQSQLYARGHDVAQGSALPVPEAIHELEEEPWPNLEAPGVLGKLVDLVRAKPGFERVTRVLLGDVVVVEDLEAARRLWREPGHRKTIVTLAGEVLDAVGILSGGSNQGTATGMLAKKREIEELRVTVSHKERDFAAVETKHKDLSRRIHKIEEALEKLSHQRHEEELSTVKLEKDLRSLEETVARHHEHEATIRLEIDNTRRELESISVERERVRGTLLELESRRGGFEGFVTERTAALDAHKADIAARRARVTELRVRAAASQERKDSSERSLIRLEERLSEIEARIERLTYNIEHSFQEAARLSHQISLARDQGISLSEQIQTNKQALAEERSGLEEASRQLRQEELGLREERKKLDALKDGMTQSLMKLREHQLAQESLRQQVNERYQLVLDELIFEYHLLPTPSEDDEDRRKKLRRQLAAIGEVNLTAIDEFKEVKERHDFLAAQRDDLLKAVEALKDAIKKINKTSRERYVETFHLVNEKFQTVFPRLFKGGQASLVLTDPDNPLESGVELLAQPPGKKLQSVTLLSGGEKALTAVALIFGIFLIKPTPFCLLDEVDAPLDDANVGRYNEMVRDMAQISQFILITHNKRTMEIPDRIYGITMEEPGISKVVGVDIKETESPLRVAS